MRGEHDELEIFLETRLISSRVDQKLKNKEREIHAFKEGNWPEIVGDRCGHGRGIKASWERFALNGDVASNPGRIGLNFASKGASK